MKNKKLTIISIAIMLIGLGLLVFGLIDSGNMSGGKLKGQITDETASFLVTFECEKTTIAVGETTNCTVYVDVGSNSIYGLQGKVEAGDNISLGTGSAYATDWMYLGNSVLTYDNPQTGNAALINIPITGVSEGTSSLKMVEFSHALQVSDNDEQHPVTSDELTITVTNGGDTPTPPVVADNTLKSLTISAGTLNPEFNKDVTVYTASVANDVTSITVDAEATDSSATVTGTGDINLNVGENTIPVVVKVAGAEDNTYTIVVSRSADEQETAETDLKSVTVNNGVLVPAFDKDITSYSIQVGPNVAEIGITVEAANPEATVTGAGTVQITDENEPIVIEVTDTKGNQKRYTFNIVKQSVDTECELSSAYYGIDNTNLLITKVDLNDSDETIANRINPTCGTIAVANNKLVLTYGDKTKTYTIERSWVPKTGNIKVNYFAIIGGIVMLMGAALFVYTKFKKQD